MLGSCSFTFVLFRYLSTGDSQSTIAFSYRVGKSTISKIIYETCAAIWEVLLPKVLTPPSNHAQWQSVASEFERLWNFPLCVGAIDGKHVTVECPANSGSEFFNHKKTFSIVLLAVSDAHYCFTLLDVGDAGRHSDGGVLANSTFGKAIMLQHLDLPPPADIGNGVVLPHFFVGDAAFPLRENLMRLYPGRNLPEDQRILNYRLSRARRVVENAFGILSSRWRIFWRAIIGPPEKAVLVTKAACALHNLLQEQNRTLTLRKQYYCPPGYADAEDRQGNVTPGRWRKETTTGLRRIGRTSCNSRPSVAAAIRDAIKTYCTSAQGAVTWQRERVNQS